MLCVDIGNTHTVIGLFRDQKLLAKWRLTTQTAFTSDEIELRVRGMIGMRPVDAHPIGRAVVATVVPSLERGWRKALERIVEGKVAALSHRNCGFPVEYLNPAQIGPDRLANALAAERMGLRDVIVIDLGTATTFDVVKNGTYLGGAICPGIETGMQALSGRTARLSQVALEIPERTVGRDTEGALCSGLVLGHIGMMEYLTRRIRSEEDLPSNTPVLATGGWSQVLRGHADFIDAIHPDLTLEGLEYFCRTRLT